MKTPRCIALVLTCAALSSLHAQTYTNFIRQVQLPLGVQWDASVASQGDRNSVMPIDLGGSRFELWTVKSSPLTSYLLDTRFVGAFAPAADVTFRSEDPYALVPRTRADRPFFVDVTVSGLISGATAPDSAKSVKLLRYVQSYGLGGIGDPIDRTKATLLSQAMVTQNGMQTLSYTITAVPSTNLAKTAGEERFSVFSVADSTYPEAQLASRYIQIWPLADGSISGITGGQKIRFTMPQVTLTLNDLYPSSDTYAQIYPGTARLGVTGTRVTSLVTNDSVPKSRVLILKDYDAFFTVDGTWTMELVTVTPFGTDRLSYVTFDLDRTIRVNSMITTKE
jgi:hypothetical protein